MLHFFQHNNIGKQCVLYLSLSNSSLLFVGLHLYISMKSTDVLCKLKNVKKFKCKDLCKALCMHLGFITVESVSVRQLLRNSCSVLHMVIWGQNLNIMPKGPQSVKGLDRSCHRKVWLGFPLTLISISSFEHIRQIILSKILVFHTDIVSSGWRFWKSFYVSYWEQLRIESSKVFKAFKAREIQKPVCMQMGWEMHTVVLITKE